MPFTGREKAFCVLEYVRSQSNKTVHNAFVREFSKQPPTAMQIWTSHKNLDSTNNSLAHPEETLENETIQATTRSGHNGRGQAKAQTELACAMYQACVKSAMKSTYL